MKQKCRPLIADTETHEALNPVSAGLAAHSPFEL